MRGLVKEGKVANPLEVAARLRAELGIAELEERANAGVRQLVAASAASAVSHPAETAAEASQRLDGDTMVAAIALRLSTLAITGSTRSRDIKALVPSVKTPSCAAGSRAGAQTFAATPVDSDSVAGGGACAGSAADPPFDISHEDQGRTEPGIARCTSAQPAEPSAQVRAASSTASTAIGRRVAGSSVSGQIAAADLLGPIETPVSMSATAPHGAASSNASACASSTAQAKTSPLQPAAAAVVGAEGEHACYMHQDGSIALDEVVSEMISMAYFFQERRRGDESKGKAGGVKRRIIVGMREVLRDCRAAKLKVVIICRNLEGSGVDGGWGAGSALATEVRGRRLFKGMLLS